MDSFKLSCDFANETLAHLAKCKILCKPATGAPASLQLHVNVPTKFPTTKTAKSVFHDDDDDDDVTKL